MTFAWALSEGLLRPEPGPGEGGAKEKVEVQKSGAWPSVFPQLPDLGLKSCLVHFIHFRGPEWVHSSGMCDAVRVTTKGACTCTEP